ncbi:unnamed protein product [Vitrella brassicaformis CCMP3155]|uniref:Nucleotide-diphospho-sugar transferase domain-containing protein n=2 Tax=Vitrella brassicaformis TaxID=1169539 RepID=A0A0G4H577_VITBC|nr:unnamed protein product [Vitrella brassicaformis CCMP3155]|eukprot:CEM38755.1 unnamed protein product [Vitrella brassicaformis CCMP3155]
MQAMLISGGRVRRPAPLTVNLCVPAALAGLQAFIYATIGQWQGAECFLHCLIPPWSLYGLIAHTAACACGIAGVLMAVMQMAGRPMWPLVLRNGRFLPFVNASSLKSPVPPGCLLAVSATSPSRTLVPLMALFGLLLLQSGLLVYSALLLFRVIPARMRHGCDLTGPCALKSLAGRPCTPSEWRREGAGMPASSFVNITLTTYAVPSESFPEEAVNRIETVIRTYALRHGLSYFDGRTLGNGTTWWHWASPLFDTDPPPATFGTRSDRMPRHTWAKLPLLAHLIGSRLRQTASAVTAMADEWVMWLDSDVVIMNHLFSLQPIVQTALAFDKFLVACPSNNGWDTLINGMEFNAGVMLVRCSHRSLEYLRHVWRHGISHGRTHLADQPSYMSVIHRPAFRDGLLLVPRCVMNSKPHAWQMWQRYMKGDFIAHAAGDDFKAARLQEYSTAVLERRPPRLWTYFV